MPTPTLNVSPRFGVEIEFMGPATGAEVVNELRKIGIEAADVGYTHSVVDYWKVVPETKFHSLEELELKFQKDYS